MTSYDIIIIGAGPAGCVLAWQLKSSFRVLLVDSRRETGEGKRMGKPCGGLLNKNGQQALAALGLPLPGSAASQPQVFSIRAIDIDSGLERFYPRDYVNVDRDALDEMLLKLALRRPNVTYLSGQSVTKIEPRGDRVEVEIDFGKLRAEAAFAAGADGALSFTRRSLGGQQVFSRPPRIYAAKQEWYETDTPLPHFVALFDQRVSDFYSWVIPKEKGFVIGSAIPADGRSAKQAFALFKEDLEKSGLSLGKPTKAEGSAILKPQAFGSFSSGKGRIFLLGEAAGLISPSGAEGISFALLSARALARAMNRHSDPREIHRAYRRKTGGLRRKIFFKALKAPIMYRPLPRRLVFQTKLLSLRHPGR